MKTIISAVVMIMIGLIIYGIYVAAFRKPYKEAIYDIVDPNVTAYVIPLEDSTEKQVEVGKSIDVPSSGVKKPIMQAGNSDTSSDGAKKLVKKAKVEKGGVSLNSAEDYERYKVSMSRIEIPRRWKKTGWLPTSGKWIKTVYIIKVNRTPINRLWTSDENSGTSKKNEAIWVESKDSVSFSLPFNCTANIKQENTSTYLYWYPNGNLAKIMDGEIRDKVQAAVSEFCGDYELDILREKKIEMNDFVRKQVVDYYKEKGITITTLGLAGDIEYRNPKVQSAIDDVFIAQQKKHEEKALSAASKIRQGRLKAEGEATAGYAEEYAKGEADSSRIKAEGEAGQIEQELLGLATAQKVPVFLEVQILELEKKKWNAWDGNYAKEILPSNGSTLYKLDTLNR